jgi:hypothetical protein
MDKARPERIKLNTIIESIIGLWVSGKSLTMLVGPVWHQTEISEWDAECQPTDLSR